MVFVVSDWGGGGLFSSFTPIGLSGNYDKLIQTFSHSSVGKANIHIVTHHVEWIFLPQWSTLLKLWVRVIAKHFTRKRPPPLANCCGSEAIPFFPLHREAAASASPPGAPGTGSGHVSGEPLIASQWRKPSASLQEFRTVCSQKIPSRITGVP